MTSRLTPEEMKELRRLHIHAGRRVNSLFAGDYRSAVRGRGMEFEEVRGYVPGDDIRHIDWNVTARSGEPHIKVFREERQLTVILAVDVSGSTHVGSGGRDGRTDRRLQIARLAGGIAYAGIRNRDRVGLVTFSDRIETYLKPRRTRGHVWKVIQTVFDAQGAHRGTDLAEALAFLVKTQRRRAVLVVVSDFLDEGEWAKPLGILARRHQVHAILVDDPLDVGFPGLGLVELLHAETGRSTWVDGARWAGQESRELRLAALRRAGTRSLAVSTADDALAALRVHFSQVGGRR